MSNPPSDPQNTSLHPSQPGPQSPEIIAFASRMYDAARRGDLPTFQQALPAGLPPNMTNEKGDTLLILSSYHGHAPLSKLLIQHGADPNRLNDRGQSPLAGAVFKDEGEVVDVLLEGGSDVDVGRPSAWESVEIFRKEGVYRERFERQRKRLGKEAGVRGEVVPGEGTGGGGGPGGWKGATQMM